MVKRSLLIIFVVLTLASLLAYSQIRHVPLKVSGFIEADEIRLGSRVGGRVAEVFVVEGQKIESGAVLIRLEEFDLGEKVHEAEAQLQARQADLDRLVAGYRAEEIGQAAARVERLKQKAKALADGPRPEEITAGRVRVKLAEAQVELARIMFNRNNKLFATDAAAVARETLDRTNVELRVAEANKEVREQELQLLEKGTRTEDILAARAESAEAEEALMLMKNGSRKEDIESARAAVAAARAVLQSIRIQKDELQIVSSVPGLVEAVELRPGDLVPAGAPVVSVMDTRKYWVRAYVPENHLNIHPGLALKVTIDSFPGEQFNGEVTFVSRQAEFTPGNVQTPEERSKQVFRVKVTLKSGLDKLRPGMSADVWLTK